MHETHDFDIRNTKIFWGGGCRPHHLVTHDASTIFFNFGLRKVFSSQVKCKRGIDR